MNASINSSTGNSEQLRSGCTSVHPDRIIIIGAGSVDCVLASQLSQDPNVQALVEAGGLDERPKLADPSHPLSYCAADGEHFPHGALGTACGIRLPAI
jgi:hypothetical protein